MPTKLEVSKLLEKVIESNASDLLISVGNNPIIRVNTNLSPLTEYDVLTSTDVEYFLSQILQADQKDILDVNKEIDFSVALGNKARFRVNAFYQRGYPSVALRAIPMVVPSIET